MIEKALYENFVAAFAHDDKQIGGRDYVPRTCALDMEHNIFLSSKMAATYKSSVMKLVSETRKLTQIKTAHSCFSKGEGTLHSADYNNADKTTCDQTSSSATSNFGGFQRASQLVSRDCAALLASLRSAPESLSETSAFSNQCHKSDSVAPVAQQKTSRDYQSSLSSEARDQSQLSYASTLDVKSDEKNSFSLTERRNSKVEMRRSSNQSSDFEHSTDRFSCTGNHGKVAVRSQGRSEKQSGHLVIDLTIEDSPKVIVDLTVDSCDVKSKSRRSSIEIKHTSETSADKNIKPKLLYFFEKQQSESKSTEKQESRSSKDTVSNSDRNRERKSETRNDENSSHSDMNNLKTESSRVNMKEDREQKPQGMPKEQQESKKRKISQEVMLVMFSFFPLVC